MRNRERKRGGILQRISRHIEKLQCLRLGSRIGENINIYERIKTQIQSLGQEDPPGEENGNPLQDSCLGNPVDRGAWRATYSPWGHKRVRHKLVTKQQVSKYHLKG